MTERIVLGRVGRTFGVHGAFRIWPYADNLERFHDLREVTLTQVGKSIVVHITGVRLDKGHVIVETREFESPEDVRPWINGEVEIDESERVTLPEGQYFHDQIIGLTVRTTGGEELGEITGIIDNAANDVYVCRKGDKEILIPAVEEFIRAIDIERGTMTIEPIPGLIE